LGYSLPENAAQPDSPPMEAWSTLPNHEAGAAHALTCTPAAKASGRVDGSRCRTGACAPRTTTIDDSAEARFLSYRRRKRVGDITSRQTFFASQGVTWVPA
jgi:hypothetical protein